MLKVFAAFLAPVILILFFTVYNLFSMMLTNRFSISFSFEGFFFVYIVAFPVYLFIAVPVSIIIERIGRDIRWINYMLAGLIAGCILVFINSMDNSDGFVITCIHDGRPFFYADLRLFELLDQKLLNQ